jgi:hypothetical protein
MNGKTLPYIRERLSPAVAALIELHHFVRNAERKVPEPQIYLLVVLGKTLECRFQTGHVSISIRIPSRFDSLPPRNRKDGSQMEFSLGQAMSQITTVHFITSRAPQQIAPQAISRTSPWRPD